jgi:hypothetical protein
VAPVILLALAFAMAGAAFLVLVLRLLFPYHRRVALVLYGCSWLPFLAGVWQHQQALLGQGQLLEDALGGRVLLVVLAVALLGLGYLQRVLFPLRPSPLALMDDRELHEQLRQDETLLAYLVEVNQQTQQRLLDSELLAGRGQPLVPQEEALLREAWQRLTELNYELNHFTRRYQQFFRIHPVKRRSLHLRAFLLSYGAFVEQYRAGVTLAREVSQNGVVQAIFNEESAQLGAGGFASLCKHLVHPDTVVRLNAGRAYFALLGDDLEGDLPGLIRRHLEDIDRTAEERVDVFFRSPLNYLERKAFTFWLPVQKEVAELMSHLRTTDRPFFLRPEHLRPIAGRLQPGDIMLQRREWCLTNLGIPGYWTHAALYLGPPELLDAHFAGLPELEGASASAYLQARHPEAWATLCSPDEDDNPRAVIEALRPGVVLNSFERSNHADSMCALRVQRADRSRQLAAVDEALRHFGKPYDYNFDFATEGAVVCSELVYQAWRAGREIELEPKQANGRLLLSPNEIAIKFDREYDEPDPELALVVFLDGLPDGSIVERGAAELRESWSRPKWHILVTDPEG